MAYYGTSTVARQILGNLHQIGFYDFILPWLFAFALVYGILVMSNLFGGNRTIYAILAMVVAFFVANYTPYGTTLSLFFSTLFGQGGFVLAGILVTLMFLVILFPDEWQKIISEPLTFLFNIFGKDAPGGQYIIFGGLLLLVGAAILLSSANFFGINFSAPRIDQTTLSALFIFGIIIVVVFAVSRSGGS